MLKILATSAPATPLLLTSSLLTPSLQHLPKLRRLFTGNAPGFPISHPSPTRVRPIALRRNPMTSWLGKIGFGKRTPEATMDSSSAASVAQGPDDDIPAPDQQFATFGAGCFWGVELAYQRVPGVTKTEVGYSQGFLHNPTYDDICTGTTNHSEVVRVQYDPKECRYENLLDVFWARHDPTTLNRQLDCTGTLCYALFYCEGSYKRGTAFFQFFSAFTYGAYRRSQTAKGNDVGTQYRSGIYYYTEEQEKIAKESRDHQQKILNKNIVTEIIPAKKFYRAEKYHQQYLAKGGRLGFKQSAEKGCKDPIRCYG